MATVRPIFTISHSKNAKTAVPELMVLVLLVNPRANKAAGTTTAKAPYAADQAAETRPVKSQVKAATAKPTTTCAKTTRQMESRGC